MTTTLQIAADVAERPVRGRGLEPASTIGSVLDRNDGLTLLVFLRHHG